VFTPIATMLLMHKLGSLEGIAKSIVDENSITAMQHDSVNCKGTNYTTANKFSPGIC